MSTQNGNGKTAITVVCTILGILLLGFKVATKMSRNNAYRARMAANTELADMLNAKIYLRELVDTLNARAPYADSFGQIDSFQYKNSEVVVHISLDEESEGRISAIRSNEENVAKSYMTLYSYPFLFQRTLLELMAEAKANMTLDFKEPKTDDSFQLDIRTYMISEAVKDTNVSAMDYILAENELLNTRNVATGQDSYLKNVAIEGNYRVYHYQSEDYVISYLNSIRQQRKREILKTYKDAEGEDLLKDAGLGMKYVFENIRSAQKCIITIENSEL